MDLDPVIAVIIRVCFALLFITAAMGKFDTPRFRALLDAYKLVPDSLLSIVARCLPVLEITVGIFWAAGIHDPAVALVTVSLLAVYAAAIAINLLRGNSHIDCGCSFAGTGQSLSWGLVLRNLCLVAIAGTGTLPVIDRSLGPVDWFTIVIAVPAGLLLYAAFNQLLANHRAMIIRRRPVEYRQ